METERAKTVKIRYRCRLADGSEVRIGDGDIVEMTAGAGKLPAGFDNALLETLPGQHFQTRVAAAEIPACPWLKGAYLVTDRETPPGMAYDFGPGDGGDVSLAIPPKHVHEPLPPGADLFFEIEVLE